MSSISRFIHDGLGALPLDRQSCQLLGPTALVVQALMGVLAVLSLVYKRHRETQKRPWKIWLFDVNKQVLGAMFVHVLNVFISDLGSHQSARNACTFYFLHILLDTTLGVGLIYLALQSSTWLLSNKLGIKGLKTGQYGNPPSLAFWSRQAAVYVSSITTMKFLVVALLAVWPGIFRIGDWLLGWTTMWDGETVQVVFVMGIFPIIMNILQFWLIDSIVKASTTSVDARPTPRNSNSLDREPLFPSPDDDDVSQPDIEHGARSSSSRTMSEGDFKTLVDAEDNKTKLFASGSSSPKTLPRTSVVLPHDYPPNVDSASSQSSTRSRHKYRRSPSSLLDLPVAYSAPTVDTTPDQQRSSSRQAVFSKSLDNDHDVAEFDAWEKKDLEQRTDEEGHRCEPSRTRVG